MNTETRCNMIIVKVRHVRAHAFLPDDAPSPAAKGSSPLIRESSCTPTINEAPVRSRLRRSNYCLTCGLGRWSRDFAAPSETPPGQGRLRIADACKKL